MMEAEGPAAAGAAPAVKQEPGAGAGAGAAAVAGPAAAGGPAGQRAADFPSGLRVLVVDDDPLTLKVLAAVRALRLSHSLPQGRGFSKPMRGCEEEGLDGCGPGGWGRLEGCRPGGWGRRGRREIGSSVAPQDSMQPADTCTCQQRPLPQSSTL